MINVLDLKPSINFSRGISFVEVPELEAPTRGKVRDCWAIQRSQKRIMVTTDRQAVFARPVCTVPFKGQVGNRISGFWFEQTKDIFPNHLLSVLHPNIMIVKQATVIPVEVIIRRYIAASSSSTSLGYNYFQLGRRNIYGINFPNGLLPNQELPDGAIITPTTKAEDGHDEELTHEEAKAIVERVAKRGTWDAMRRAALELFDFVYKQYEKKGFILADTKCEFGIDSDGELMLIDEAFTPECSRIWERQASGELLVGKKKDVLLEWLTARGFSRDSQVSEIDGKVIEAMSDYYKEPFIAITGQSLSAETSAQEVGEVIRQAILTRFFV